MAENLFWRNYLHVYDLTVLKNVGRVKLENLVEFAQLTTTTNRIHRKSAPPFLDWVKFARQ